MCPGHFHGCNVKHGLFSLRATAAEFISVRRKPCNGVLRQFFNYIYDLMFFLFSTVVSTSVLAGPFFTLKPRSQVEAAPEGCPNFKSGGGYKAPTSTSPPRAGVATTTTTFPSSKGGGCPRGPRPFAVRGRAPSGRPSGGFVQ